MLPKSILLFTAFAAVAVAGPLHRRGGEEAEGEAPAEGAEGAAGGEGEAAGETGAETKSAGGNSSASGDQFTGTATFYNLENSAENEGYEPGSVACSSDKFTNSDRIVALAADGFQEDWCGKTIVMTDPSTGNTGTAVVQDQCVPCTKGDVDMTPVVWNGLHGEGKEGDGIFTVEWHFE